MSSADQQQSASPAGQQQSPADQTRSPSDQPPTADTPPSDTPPPNTHHTATSTSIGDDPATRRVSRNLRNEGHFDVVFHADTNGRPLNNLTEQQIAAAIRANPNFTPGTPIRLVACNAGNNPDLAQRLANELGSPVHAATDAVGVPARPDSPAHIRNNGTWQTHTPQTSSTPTTSPQPSPNLTAPSNEQPTDNSPVDLMGDTPPQDDSDPDAGNPDPDQVGENKKRPDSEKPSDSDPAREGTKQRDSDDSDPGKREDDSADDNSTADDTGKDDSGDDSAVDDEADSKQPDPNNPGYYTDGTTIPTDSLVHPDMDASELQRLQAIEESLNNAVDEYKRNHNGDFPPAAPGVGRGDPAVEALIPSGYDPCHGVDLDERIKQLTKPNGKLDWADPDTYPEGFADPSAREPVVLPPGEIIDRFGGDHGRFTSPPGVSYPERALPPTNLEGEQYHQYEVIRPLPVWMGEIAPQMGEPGLGSQHYLPVPVRALIEGGYLREVPPMPRDTSDTSDTPPTSSPTPPTPAAASIDRPADTTPTSPTTNAPAGTSGPEVQASTAPTANPSPANDPGIGNLSNTSPSSPASTDNAPSSKPTTSPTDTAPVDPKTDVRPTPATDPTTPDGSRPADAAASEAPTSTPHDDDSSTTAPRNPTSTDSAPAADAASPPPADPSRAEQPTTAADPTTADPTRQTDPAAAVKNPEPSSPGDTASPVAAHSPASPTTNPSGTEPTASQNASTPTTPAGSPQAGSPTTPAATAPIGGPPRTDQPLAQTSSTAAESSPANTRSAEGTTSTDKPSAPESPRPTPPPNTHHTPTSTSIGDDPATHRVRENLRNEGHFDVILHADANGRPLGGLTEQQIIDAIRSNPNYKPGTPIRLVACNAANNPELAQRLANELGSPVTVPTNAVGTPNKPDSPAHVRDGGTWTTHHPTRPDGTTPPPTTGIPQSPNNTDPTTPIDYMGDDEPATSTPPAEDPPASDSESDSESDRPKRPGNEVGSGQWTVPADARTVPTMQVGPGDRFADRTDLPANARIPVVDSAGRPYGTFYTDSSGRITRAELQIPNTRVHPGKQAADPDAYRPGHPNFASNAINRDISEPPPGAVVRLVSDHGAIVLDTDQNGAYARDIPWDPDGQLREQTPDPTSESPGTDDNPMNVHRQWNETDQVWEMTVPAAGHPAGGSLGQYDRTSGEAFATREPLPANTRIQVFDRNGNLHGIFWTGSDGRVQRVHTWSGTDPEALNPELGSKQSYQSDRDAHKAAEKERKKEHRTAERERKKAHNAAERERKKEAARTGETFEPRPFEPKSFEPEDFRLRTPIPGVEYGADREDRFPNAVGKTPQFIARVGIEGTDVTHCRPDTTAVVDRSDYLQQKSGDIGRKEYPETTAGEFALFAGGHKLANSLGGLSEFLNYYPQWAPENSGTWQDGANHWQSWFRMETDLTALHGMDGVTVNNLTVWPMHGDPPTETPVALAVMYEITLDDPPPPRTTCHARTFHNLPSQAR
ncbi:glycohydrolase toxin TNT-related protein [Nocardia sp. NPDC127579]|uniref:glycohydrolase toxin TNT-related protein n=1 Tax=Nocardia sp. NPDC127579 TaxID=3345402 RepID=UPI0036358EA3